MEPCDFVWVCVVWTGIIIVGGFLGFVFGSVIIRTVLV